MLHFDTFCWENLTRDKLNTEVVFQSFTEVSKLIESDHKKLFLEGIFWKIGEGMISSGISEMFLGGGSFYKGSIKGIFVYVLHNTAMFHKTQKQWV